MKQIILLFTFLSWFSACNDSSEDTNKPEEEIPEIENIASPIPGYTLVWHDEFDEDEVDETAWSYRNWDSWIGSTMCLEENVSQADGYMKIKMELGEYTDPETGKSYEATGGGLITRQRYRFGYYEVSAKLSDVKGWHSAFWTHWSNSNKHADHFKGWQSAPRTEIDIFEHCAEYDETTYTYGMYEIKGTYPDDEMSSVHRDMHFGDTNLTDRFNTYGFEYAEEYLNYFFNGELIKTVDMRNVEHQHFYIWLSVIATRTPDGDGEVLWDYLRCFEPDADSDEYKERKAYFIQLLDDRKGGDGSEGADLWVEAEDFLNLGGWTVIRDDNVMVLSGHAQPPANDDDRYARTRIQVEEAGEYHLWVRGKDFKDNLPGRRHFQVHVNGAIFTGFGKHAGDELYEWEYGGVVSLHAGANQLEIYDSSCYYAKCDKLLLTTDAKFKPTGIGAETNVEHIEEE